MKSLESQIDEFINSTGFATICIGAERDSPPFAYTVGLTETYDCPEFLIFGVGDQVAVPVFQAIVSRIKKGERFVDGNVLEQILNVPCVVKAVNDEVGLKYALNVSARYVGSGRSPAFQQIVYPDEAGRFPWVDGYSVNMRRIQKEVWTSVH